MIKDVLDILADDFLDGKTPGQEDSLFRSRQLDSMDLVRLVAALEEHFDITINPRDITPDNFDTARNISAFLQEHRR